MANTQAMCTSFKVELMDARHQFGAPTIISRTSLTVPTPDSFKASLYLTTATINAESNYSDATVKALNGISVGCHAVDTTTVHSVWSDNTSQDLMHDSQTDGGTWGTDVNEWTATINRVSANIYTRSGSKVLAVLVDDGGTVKYNEKSLAAGLTLGLSGVAATG